MAKVSPWHSVKKSDPQVYHDRDDCHLGNNIEEENKRPGTAGRPQCSECSRLSRGK